MAIQSTDIGALHEAILAAVRTQYPLFKTVEDYPVDKQPPAVPAFWLEMESAEQDVEEDPETGQVALELRFAARIILPSSQASVGRAARILAADISAFINKSRFGCPVNAARVGMLDEDAFEPHLDQFTVWRIEWTMVALVGTNVWASWEDVIASSISTKYSFAPTVGPDHEDQYEDLVMPLPGTPQTGQVIVDEWGFPMISEIGVPLLWG